jgi:phage terminase large subunit-like protein
MTTALNDDAIREIANYLKAQGVTSLQPTNINRLPLVQFAHRNFYIPGDDWSPAKPIKLLPHQVAILEFMFNPPPEHTPNCGYFQTIIYSTVKKSGKTTIGSLVGRWAAETWARFGEVYSIANDYEQAKGRIFQKILESIILDPRYHSGHREIPDLWRVIDRELTHIPSGTKIKALAGDYKGEAGGNPTLTLWSELWGFSSEASRRLWDEMTPVPTRAKSCRFIETYAGFEDESDLLLGLYNQGKKEGIRVDVPGWPFEDPCPVYVNKEAGLIMYWDDGPLARRMPWQTPDYYSLQAKTLRPNTFDRLHNNYWTSSVESFMPLEWWDACFNPDMPPLDNRTPCVIGVDAAVTDDNVVCSLISRHTKIERGVAIRAGRIWKPSRENPINYSAPMGLKETIKEWCSRYNVVQVAYDAYQLHNLMTDLRLDGVAWCKPFSQGGDRNRADKQLYDLVRDRALEHYGDQDMREHVKNAGSKSSKDEDTKFRIVKRTTDGKIDYVIANSMGSAECLRLNT